LQWQSTYGINLKLLLKLASHDSCALRSAQNVKENALNNYCDFVLCT
jgi:hypothetical protein